MCMAGFLLIPTAYALFTRSAHPSEISFAANISVYGLANVFWAQAAKEPAQKAAAARYPARHMRPEIFLVLTDSNCIRPIYKKRPSLGNFVCIIVFTGLFL
mgnify:CR=1 FL=1